MTSDDLWLIVDRKAIEARKELTDQPQWQYAVVFSDYDGRKVLAMSEEAKDESFAKLAEIRMLVKVYHRPPGETQWQAYRPKQERRSG